MMIYHVDRYYESDGKIYYASFPYNLKGTLWLYFGMRLRPLSFAVMFHPWWSRYTKFFKWMLRARLSPRSADKLAARLNCIK